MVNGFGQPHIKRGGASGGIFRTGNKGKPKLHNVKHEYVLVETGES